MANDTPGSSPGGGSTLVWLGSAAILGVSILAAGALVAQSLKGTAEQIEALRVAMTDLAKARGAAAPQPQPPAAPTARRGLDPKKRYSVDVGQYVKGPADAPVTIVEWSDFQCPFCRRSRPTLEQIERVYGDKVRVSFRHLPLDSIHPKAPAAHAAAAAAGLQGKFWEMHDKIFDNQQQMAPEKYVQWAGELGLDVDRFKRDMASDEVKKTIDADKQAADALGITGTPAFFVNGRYVRGAQPFPTFKTLIDAELKDS